MKTDPENFKLLWGVDPTGEEIPDGYMTQRRFAEELIKKDPKRIADKAMVKALFGI